MVIIKTFLSLLLIAVSDATTVIQLQAQCPNLQATDFATEQLSVDIDTSSTNSEAQYELQLEPFPTDLCTLTIVSTDPENPYLIPVARSFDNRQWQLAAGPFAASLDLDCPGNDDGSACKIHLPPIKNEETYRLTSHKPYTSNPRAHTIRFLERATFGATGDQPVIENWEDWVEQQFNEPPTLHREVFRRHANPRSNRHTRIAETGPHPCNSNSRWRRFAFTHQDAGKTLRMTTLRRQQGEEIVLMVDGVFRTKLSAQVQLVQYDDRLGVTLEAATPMNFDTDYEICSDMSTFYQESTVVRVRWQGQGQERCLQFRDGNPSIQTPTGLADGAHTTGNSTNYILSIPNSALVPIDDETYPSLYWKSYQSGDEFRLTAAINEASCSIVSMDSGPPMVYGRLQNSNDEVLLYDPRVVLQANTVENPIPDGGGSLVLETNNLVNCANAPRTFLNEDHCVLSTAETACRANEALEIEIELSEEFIKAANEITGRYIYALDNLPINDESYRDDDNQLQYYNEPPCGPQTPSRWMRVDASICRDPNYRTVGLQTQTAFGGLLQRLASSTDSLLEDVLFFRGLECDEADTEKRSLGFIRDGDGQCWQNVNRRHLNVYDMTDFVAHHPGGVEPIERWAKQGSGRIILPDSHQENGNARLQQSLRQSKFLGKLGSRASLSDVPPILQTERFLNEFGIFPLNPMGAGVVVCGSVGEVANEPTLGTGYLIESFEKGSARQPPTKGFSQGQKVGIWTQIALSSLDQLRQRVAFALSQILVVSPQLLKGQEGTETTLSFYDIFVRHAFGNYRDVLKEVSFHPKMGEMLSSLNSKSFQYLADRGEEAYPDENFAREIMQLFSIGLYRLNMNGTIQLDEDGEPLPTYDNSDILSFARVWTGMRQQEKRGNYEHEFSRVDPMAVDDHWHDIFPKSDLHGGFIGDGYPLCVNMEKPFLKKGAVYRLLGSRSSPELQEDLAAWTVDSEIQRLRLDVSSPLFNQLCAAKDSGSGCSFPGKVVLQADLDYATFPDAEELKVDTLRTVQVQSDPVPVFYEYVEPICVNHVFFNNAKRVVVGVRRNGEVRSMMCADPRQAVASENCCYEALIDNVPVPFGSMNCKYNGERIKFETHEQRCNSIGMVDCDLARMTVGRSGICSKDIDRMQQRRFLMYRWSRGSCSIQIKVAENGNIAVVHNPEPDRQGEKSTPNGFHESNKNFFKVSWENNTFPSVSSGCNNSNVQCNRSGPYCICETSVLESVGFQSANAFSSNVDATIRSRLFVGASDPRDLASTYVSRGNCNGRLARVEVYTTPSTNCESFDKDTIFALEDSFERVSYRKNMLSTVSVGDVYLFRNPVSFSSFVKPTLRDAYAEMDATIDHYLLHPSHPPFLATRMLQRFGFSNPSPRLISVVAEAYQRGAYGSFGSGEYGDLKSMVAAILLDPESTSVSINSDPTHGQLREPLLKALAFLRAMNYDHKSPRLWPVLTNLQNQIGEGIYEPPDVFSFFPPDFVPGKLAAASLFSPESQVLNAGTITGLLDGLYTTTKYGMIPQQCYSGFGGEKPKGIRRCPLRRMIGDYSYSMGNLTYGPTTITAEGIVNELAVLLTADRLQEAHRQRIVQEIQPFVFDDLEKAVRLTQQLVVSTPEFHATNKVRSSGNQRATESSTAPKTGDYKVVVYLMLTGGMDSFNLLVPKGGCASTDLYEKYKEVRGNAALDPSDLESIVTSGQHCNEFGVNNRFNLLKDLYAEGDAMFFANIGTLDKPVTKADWLQQTRTSLFAHNTQQQELARLDIGKELDLSGVGGRMMDALKELGYQTSPTTIASPTALATGSPKKANHVKTLPRGKPSTFNTVAETDDMDQLLIDLNSLGEIDSSLFSEQWSSNLVQGISETRLAADIYRQFETSTNFPTDAISKKFESAATWIKSRAERNVERELIFIQHPGWDHHDVNELNNLETKLAELNGALTAFVAELKTQNVWDDVVIMSGSDFGRTLTPNSRGGTDHAWAGNSFMMGGGIKGGIIHGKYPTDFSEDGDWNIGRGRLIPTLPNEAPWQAVSQWMGATDSKDLDYILPNRKSFDACSLFTDAQLFHSGSIETSCGKVTEDEDDENENENDNNSGNEDDAGNFSGDLNGDHNNDNGSDNASSINDSDNGNSLASGSTGFLRLFAIAGSVGIAVILVCLS